MDTKIVHINPDRLFMNPAFSPIVTTQENGGTIYISGQNSVTVNREIVGKGNINEQTEQAIQDLQTALASCVTNL